MTEQGAWFKRQIDVESLVRHLLPLSTLYLGLPYLLFFIGWLRWPWAILGVALIAVPLLYDFRDWRRSAGPRLAASSAGGPRVWQIGLLVVVAFFLLLISGVGGYGYQDSDWLKHNIIFRDLIERPWPVVYEFESGQVPLVYYIAFYLPAAWVGKWGGWFWANQALFLWSLIGLSLAMLWFVALVRRFWIGLLSFVAFSGLDVLGQAIIAPLAGAFADYSDFSWLHIEWWAIGWQYASHVTSLFWVPNQAIGGWLAAALVVYSLLESHRSDRALWHLGLTALWSPFLSVGILPYLAAGLVMQAGGLLKRLRSWLSVSNLCGLLLLGTMGLFYLAKFGPIPLPFDSEVIQGLVFQFAPTWLDRLMVLFLLVLFCLFEFGICAILIGLIRPAWDRKIKGVFWTTVIVLSVLPFYRYGFWNDLVMRASIPALFVLAVLIGKLWQDPALAGWRRAALTVLVVAGAATPCIEIYRHGLNIYQNRTLLVEPAFLDIPALLRLGEAAYQAYPDLDTLVLQYVGSPQSLFFQVLARHP